MTDTNELREEILSIDWSVTSRVYKEGTTIIKNMRLRLNAAVTDQILDLITAQTQAAYKQGYIDSGGASNGMGGGSTGGGGGGGGTGGGGGGRVNPIEQLNKADKE